MFLGLSSPVLGAFTYMKFLTFSLHQDHLEGLLMQRELGPTARDSDRVDLGWAHESVFLTRSQVILTLLVQR